MIRSSWLLVVNRFFYTEDIPSNTFEILKRTSKQDAVFVDRSTLAWWRCAYDKYIVLTRAFSKPVWISYIFKCTHFKYIHKNSAKTSCYYINAKYTKWNKCIYVIREKLITYNLIFDENILIVSIIIQYVIIN